MENLDFDMPRPCIGQPVLWYRNAVVGPKKAEVVFVLAVGNRSVRARTAYGEMKETVRHVADPKLKLSKDQRENGAWDFTDEHYSKAAWTASVEDRLASLESKVAKAVAGGSSGGLEEYEEILARAKELQCEFRGRPSKTKLMAMIREAEGNADSSVVADSRPVA